MNPGDTLIITSIGYQQKKYRYLGEWKKVVFRSIPLKEEVYEISQIEITPWGTYNEFKRKFMSLDMETPRENLHPLIWDDLPPRPEKIDPIEPGIMNPVSMIYNIFSKEGKERRKYMELTKHEKKERKIEAKFNRKNVGELTGLEGDKLDRFMDFCNFTDEYILDTKEYFILERVKKKYKQFMKLDSLNSIKIE
jgi:hypothetical protein